MHQPERTKRFASDQRRCRGGSPWRAIALGMLLSFAGRSAAEAQTIKPGDRVTVIKFDVTFHSGSDVVGKAVLCENFDVDQVNGDWLWIESRHGYLHRSDVVPCDQAIEYFTERVRTDPGVDSYYQRGICWYERDEPDLAIADYNEALHLDPSDASIYYERGRAYEDKDDDRRALADLNEAIRLDPKYAWAYHERGFVYSDMGDYRKALADFNEAIRLDPQDSEAYLGRGNTHYDNDELVQAVADYSEAIGLDPYNESAWFERGRTYLMQGEYESALSDLVEAIRLDPEDESPYNYGAWLLATCPKASFRDGALAVKLATKACELVDWKDPEVLDTMAAAHAEAGNFPAAVKGEEQAIDLTPSSGRPEFESRLELYHARKPYRHQP
jgi:tetratricopeptide (TPR) repeat protein